jgi:hypothetical protein
VDRGGTPVPDATYRVTARSIAVFVARRPG